MANVSDVLTSNVNFTVDLLLELPESTDPATWVRPTWPYYVPWVGPGVVDWAQDGFIGHIDAIFDVYQGIPQYIKAIGVTYNGQCLILAPFRFTQPLPGNIWPARVEWAINPSFP